MEISPGADRRTSRSTDADQLDAMIIEGEERIAEYEAQLRDAPPDIDIARATHIPFAAVPKA